MIQVLKSVLAIDKGAGSFYKEKKGSFLDLLLK